MKTFTYSYIAKFLYKYANIPITIVLTGYLIIALFAVTFSFLSGITIFVNLMLIFLINRFYLRNYKTTPYKIAADDEKMTCSEFMGTDKTIVIIYKNIDSISGWIFSGFTNKPLLISDSSQNIIISVFPHIRNYRELLQKVFNGINDKLHQEILKKLDAMKMVPKEKKKEQNADNADNTDVH